MIIGLYLDGRCRKPTLSEAQWMDAGLYLEYVAGITSNEDLP